MITADSITCRIPSEAAIKLQELSCNVANPVASADSQTWATWISSVATVGLAVFAVLAWLNSRQTLGHMRKELREAERRAELDRQLPHLAAVVNSVHVMLLSSLNASSEMEEVNSRLTEAWTNWSTNVLATDKEFVRTAGVVCFRLRQRAMRIWRWRKMWNRYERGEIAESHLSSMYPDYIKMEEEQDELSTVGNNFVLLMQSWQSDEAVRPSEHRRMQSMLDSLN